MESSQSARTEMLRRINHLWSAAHTVFPVSPNLSSIYLSQLRALALSSGIGLADLVRQRFCSHCSVILIPGHNCTVRIRSNHSPTKPVARPITTKTCDSLSVVDSQQPTANAAAASTGSAGAGEDFIMISKRKRKPKSHRRTLNDAVYMCHHCQHPNVFNGCPRTLGIELRKAKKTRRGRKPVQRSTKSVQIKSLRAHTIRSKRKREEFASSLESTQPKPSSTPVQPVVSRLNRQEDELLNQFNSGIVKKKKTSAAPTVTAAQNSLQQFLQSLQQPAPVPTQTHMNQPKQKQKQQHQKQQQQEQTGVKKHAEAQQQPKPKAAVKQEGQRVLPAAPASKTPRQTLPKQQQKQQSQQQQQQQQPQQSKGLSLSSLYDLFQR